MCVVGIPYVSGFRFDRRMKHNAKRPSSSDLYIFSEMRGKRRATAAPKQQQTLSTKQSKKVAFAAEESIPTQNLKKEQITHQPVVYRYGIIFTWR